MALLLHHHPWSRAATAVWMLEEVGEPYELSFVDLFAGEQRRDAHTARNRMGKVPVLEDDDLVMSETAAIGLYLADRYAMGRLAPALDAAERGPYLRWSLFGAVVVEPACMARASDWTYRPQSAGFGKYEDMVATLDEAVADGPWLLGDRFSMADVTLGATVLWMVGFKMLEPTAAITAYAERLQARPAKQAADARNQAVVDERGLQRG